tara:strand:- start:2846 stop:3130 length:285 start_codon:yes stop_codon:yes gene_type:complete
MSADTVPVALRRDFFLVLEEAAVDAFVRLLLLPVDFEAGFKPALVVAFGIGPLLDHVAAEFERIMRSHSIIRSRILSNPDRCVQNYHLVRAMVK